MARASFVQELLDNTADGAYVIDVDQCIAAWNAAAERLLGFRAADVMGLPCYQILSGYGDDGCMVCRQDCLPFNAGQRGEPVNNFDVQVRTATGAPRWVNMTIIPLPVDDAPDAEATMVVLHLMRDIETKKQAEHFTADVANLTRRLFVAPVTVESGGHAPPPAALTARETQVLRLLVQGADTKAIAAQLLIGTATVRNHIQRILNKLGVHSRLEAVAYARDHHLLDD